MRSFLKESVGRGAVVAASVGSLVLAGDARAQLPAGPPALPAPTQTGEARSAPVPTPDVAAGQGAADPTVAASGGLTAEQVAGRAAQTSYQAKAAQESVAAATARSEQAWSSFLPRIGLAARYTRLSEFTMPSFATGGSVVGTTAAPGQIIVAPAQGAGFGGPYVVTAPLAGVDFKFPQVLDQYLTQATIAVPISDYFLRISQSHTAATRAEEAARWDVVTARARSYSDGKIAYFTWLRARGALVVAQQSLAVAQAHLKDAQNQFTVGNASRADVLRAETQVAAAELAVERARSGTILTERQIRVAIHAKEDERLEPGEALDAPLSPVPQKLAALVAEAHASRPEIKSIDKNAEAARKLAAAQGNAMYPQLGAYGDVTYANPNPRRIPQTDEWFPTWAVGAQLTWSPNDYLLANPAGSEQRARAAALDAQRGAIRDGIELEVTQAFQSVAEADVALVTTRRQLESALEGYRVARELFNAGRGTATTLIDAETVLAQSRFDNLNARVDARIARIRLEHALGRDVKAP